MKISSSLLFLLLYLSTITSEMSCQSIDDFEVCVNNIQITNDFSFVDSFSVDFNFSKYEEDDFQFIDFIYYYTSDSLKLVFKEYNTTIRLSSIKVESNESSLEIDGTDFGQVGTSIQELCKNSPILFESSSDICECKSNSKTAKAIFFDKELKLVRDHPVLQVTYHIESCSVVGISVINRPDY